MEQQFSKELKQKIVQQLIAAAEDDQQEYDLEHADQYQFDLDDSSEMR